MRVWLLVEILIFLVMGFSILLIWVRIKRNPQDDPRLSRGLQLLQSKISVLEDLADRTEVQVKQLTALLEQKSIDVQTKIKQAEEHVQKIERAIQKSLEVAQIFQDKIPHKEIIERQNTVKYVQAAKLAHDGVTKEEIAKLVNLPLSEVDLISKVNRDQLMFSDQQLPQWISSALEMESDNKGIADKSKDVEFSMVNFAIEEAAEPLDVSGTADAETPVTRESLENLEKEFRTVCREYDAKKVPNNIKRQDNINKVTIMPTSASHIGGKLDKKIIRKIQFPKI